MTLLPVIRLLYKNAFAHLIRDHPDLRSCIVVFNADLYHVLFLSWCMNGTTSKKAIVTLMLVDILEAVVVLLEVDDVLARITSEAASISLPKGLLGYLGSRNSLSQGT
ncbi:hypothetical protein PHYSODRAFT_299149 [Phytophthora sojae]|uniref:Uncharacterized protein n=1 Tax=Phytophthora sojae (strain P6497) TaxID=1094619 RepID=G4Z282_PHYSP|nr:hypothetical protein PHYSODRAFT_299149 [Phytophthora sojae]EGZ21417.1 hypothetical protein PHYSODRAFT_299149 [Phytophthora sojae]|eukprot:XP_009524134.1 hypothetical protein PHYSODRAFT_299149 [Phytophthora sojae]